MIKFTNLNKILKINLNNFNGKVLFNNNLFKLNSHFNFGTQQVSQKNVGAPPSKIQNEEIKPEPFIPLEKMTIDKIFDQKKKNLKETYYYFGNEKAKLSEKKYNVMEFFSKKLRRDYIRSGELDSHKYIIPVKRIRTKYDTIHSLTKNREIAAVIEGREEFPDVHIVLDKKFSDKLQK